MRWWQWLVAAAALLCPASAAWAHLTPNSEVQIDFGAHEALADIIIPQGEYAFATGNRVGAEPGAIRQATAYLASHIKVTTPGGVPWRIVFERVEFARIAGPPDLHAIARLIPPAGASARRMHIAWSAVIDRVPNHFALFVARTDFASGKLGGAREVLGALQGERRSLAIDRGSAQGLKGFAAAVILGMAHIAEGHDHLLFLLALLLPAPIVAAGLRWGGPAPPRTAAVRLARIVTAFTIGHSMTLIGAAFFGWQLPARPVEIGIALSILISAIHAWRPIFPGREPLVAAAFGLVHGLAFATVIARFGLGIEEKAVSILGFNLGIELVQLGVVLATMSPLLLLSRTRFYSGFRVGGSAVAGLASIAWIIERIAQTPNPVADAIDGALGYAPYVMMAVAVLACAAYGSTRRQRSNVAV